MANNTIKLAVYGIPPVELEGTAADTIVLGQLCEWFPAGDIRRPSTGFDGFVTKMVAVEDSFSGMSLGGNDFTTATRYTSGQKMFMIQARPGDVMWMWLLSGESSLIGEPLCSTGTGSVTPIGANNNIIGVALEAVTASLVPPVTDDLRIRVEIA
jgi:hypothetical protein